MRTLLGLSPLRALVLAAAGMKGQRRAGPVRLSKESSLLAGEKRHGSPGFQHPHLKQSSKTQLYTVSLLSFLAIVAVVTLAHPRPLKTDSQFSVKEDLFPNGGSTSRRFAGPRALVAGGSINSADGGAVNLLADASPTNVSQKSDVSRGSSETQAQAMKAAGGRGILGSFGSWLGRGSSTLSVAGGNPENGAKGPSLRRKKKKGNMLLELDEEEFNTGRFGSNGTDSCDPRHAILRIYMYELEGEFNFGLLHYDYMHRLPKNISDIPRYRGGMYQQHSPEFWLTVDLLTSNMKDRMWPCSVVRVLDPYEADLIWVPFFASIAYNRYTNEMSRISNRTLEMVDRNRELQYKLVDFLQQQELWNRSNGRDHVIVIHHPNSLHAVREELGSAIFVLADFGRYRSSMANVEKDVIAPYKHVIPTFADDQNGFEERDILLFFQGMIVRKEGGIIRQQLYELLKDEEGVHFVNGNTQREGIRSATKGMRSSRFCLHLAGDTPSSNRLFDAIVSHCVPVIISDDIELPFEDFLDYSEFCIFVRGNDSLVPGHLLSLLRGMKSDEWTAMWERLKQVEVHFEYRFPSRSFDATYMVWRALAKKVPSVNFLLHRRRRYLKSTQSLAVAGEALVALSTRRNRSRGGEAMADDRGSEGRQQGQAQEHEVQVRRPLKPVVYPEDGELALRRLVISAEREIPGRHHRHTSHTRRRILSERVEDADIVGESAKKTQDDERTSRRGDGYERTQEDIQQW